MLVFSTPSSPAATHDRPAMRPVPDAPRKQSGLLVNGPPSAAPVKVTNAPLADGNERAKKILQAVLETGSPASADSASQPQRHQQTEPKNLADAPQPFTPAPVPPRTGTANSEGPGVRRWWNGDEVEIIGPDKDLAGMLAVKRVSDGKTLTIASQATEAANAQRSKDEFASQQADFRKLNQPHNERTQADRGTIPASQEPAISNQQTLSDKEKAPNPGASPDANCVINGPWSMTGHRILAMKARSFDLTADEYRSAFEWTVGNKAAIKQHLGEKSLKELAPKVSGMKKGEVIDRIYTQMVDRFVPATVMVEGLQMGKWEEALEASQRKALAGVTDKSISEMRAKLAENQEKQRRCQEDPRTLDEYRTFTRIKGVSALNDDQLARWDQQEADLERNHRRERRVRDAKVAAVYIGAVGAQIVQTKHTVKGHDLWVVKLEERVDKERYTQLSDAAKKMGGYYSSFRGNGAVPGFQFRESEVAEKFVSLTKGQSVDLTEQNQERQIERMGNAVERMRALADRTESRAIEVEQQDRLTNTARRASMAASAVKEARRTAANAGTLRNIANGIDAGAVEFLDQIRSLSDVETLERELNRAHWTRARAKADADKSSYGVMEKAMEEPYDSATIRHLDHPTLSISQERALSIAATMKSTSGLKRAGADLEKRAAALSTTESVSPTVEIKPSDSLFHDLSKVDDPWLPIQIAETERLDRMGATNIHCLRQMAREYLPYRAEARVDTPLALAERELVGRKIPGFFPTPKTLIRDMVAEAGITKGMRVLEPEAGKGDIADAARDLGAVVDCIEPVGDLRKILELKGHTLVAHDFMEYKQGGYQRILMNPPFENGQDIDHVRHAYDLLAPGGQLSAIMSAGPFSRSDNKATDFRDWLAQVNGTNRPNPDGSFAGADSFRRTMVSTNLVIIDKPDQ